MSLVSADIVPARQAPESVLARENTLLRQRIAQLEETLGAVRDGSVDALVIAGACGKRLFTLDGADRAYRLLVEEMGEGAVTLTPAGLIVYANRRFAELLGRPLQRVIGSCVAGCFGTEAMQTVLNLLAEGPVSKRSAEVELLTEAGSRVPVMLSVRRLPVAGMPDAVCMVITDLTVQKLGEATLQARESLLEANQGLVIAAQRSDTLARDAATHLADVFRSSDRDALTDTPNRALMLDRVERSIALARRRQTRAAVLFIDLDDFKRINDLQGHAAGDEALRQAARRLESVLRDADTVSRHGGDEFLVLLGLVTDACDAARIACRLLEALAGGPEAGEVLAGSGAEDKEIRLSASVGIAVYPEDGEDPSTLISCADLAMFESKRRGPGGFGFRQAALGHA